MRIPPAPMRRGRSRTARAVPNRKAAVSRLSHPPLRRRSQTAQHCRRPRTTRCHRILTRTSICIPTLAGSAHAHMNRVTQLVERLPRNTIISGLSSRPQVAAPASPLSPMLPHSGSPLPPLDAEHQHGRSVGASDRALSASSTPSRLESKVFASPAERLPSGREAAAAWLLCGFIAALALGVTSGLHNSEPPAGTVADKTAIRWHIRSVCTLPVPCPESGTAILEPW
jgi:hypothetical protein